MNEIDRKSRITELLEVVSAVIRPASLKPAGKQKVKRQYAALPFRTTKTGSEVLLVTSRDSGRWIIPKGWPKKTMTPYRLALLEAYEEAGVRGKIGRDPIGEYAYVKRFDDRKDVLCRVGVYPLQVKEELKSWPEKKERERRWVSPAEAAELVEEPDLSELLRSFKPKP